MKAEHGLLAIKPEAWRCHQHARGLARESRDSRGAVAAGLREPCLLRAQRRHPHLSRCRQRARDLPGAARRAGALLFVADRRWRPSVRGLGRGDADGVRPGDELRCSPATTSAKRSTPRRRCRPTAFSTCARRRRSMRSRRAEEPDRIRGSTSRKRFGPRGPPATAPRLTPPRAGTLRSATSPGPVSRPPRRCSCSGGIPGAAAAPIDRTPTSLSEVIETFGQFIRGKEPARA